MAFKMAFKNKKAPPAVTGKGLETLIYQGLTFTEL